MTKNWLGIERDDSQPRPLWGGMGVRQSIELGIGLACGFALISALGAFIVWMIRQFD